MCPTDQPVAAATYHGRRAEITAMLALLLEDLKHLDAQQKAKPADWGYAGSLGGVREDLMGILVLLSGCRNEGAARAAIKARMLKALG